MGKFIILLRIAAAFAGWYYAKKKGYNGYLWAALCGLIPFLVLVVMFLPPKKSQAAVRRCPYCMKPLAPGATVCGFCRRVPPIDLTRCGNCGAYVPLEAACSQCKAPLSNS